MKSVKRIYAIFVARNLEFFRDRSTCIWQLLFPIVVVILLSFAFSNNEGLRYSVGVLNLEKEKEQHPLLFQNKFIDFIDFDNMETGLRKVEQHSIDMLLDVTTSSYWINQESKNATLVESLLFNLSQNQKNSAGNKFTKKTISGKAIRYVDWVIPGMLAMNMMISALFGVGYVIVRYRKNGVLKRLKATPTRPIEFLVAQVCSRLFIIMFNLLVIFFGLNIIFKFRMRGSYFDMFIAILLGSVCLLSLGLIVAARFRNEEVANGILSLITWPFMMLSEIWFSFDNTNEILQKISAALPVTQITKLTRAIMLDGKTLIEMPFQLIYLLVFSVVCLFVGSVFFRWE